MQAQGHGSNRPPPCRAPSRRWPAALVLAGSLVLAGCGGGTLALFFDDCEDAMAAARRELGEPDKIVTDHVDDWQIVVFGYWTLGLTRRFEWASYQECEVTDTRHPPLQRPPAAAVIAPSPGAAIRSPG